MKSFVYFDKIVIIFFMLHFYKITAWNFSRLVAIPLPCYMNRDWFCACLTTIFSMATSLEKEWQCFKVEQSDWYFISIVNSWLFTHSGTSPSSPSISPPAIPAASSSSPFSFLASSSSFFFSLDKQKNNAKQTKIKLTTLDAKKSFVVWTARWFGDLQV